VKRLKVMLIVLSVLAISLPAYAYPPAGEDYYNDVRLYGTLEIFDIGTCDVVLSGADNIVSRGDPYDPGDGREEIDTEIIDLNLGGSCPGIGPIEVTDNSDPATPSTGKIKQQTGGSDFPAESFFDVYFMIDFIDLGLTAYNPFSMNIGANVYSIPFSGAIFGPGDVLPEYLYDYNNPETQIGVLVVDSVIFYYFVTFDMEFYQIDRYDQNTLLIENSHWGVVSINYEPSQTPIYLNVVAEDDVGEGKWIVANAPLLPEIIVDHPTRLEYVFDLARLGYEDGDVVPFLNAGYTVSPFLASVQPIPDNFADYAVSDISYDYQGRPGGPHYNFKSNVFPDDIGYFVIPPPPPPRILYRDNMSNVEAGTNECGPAAAANSLDWLANEHGWWEVPPIDDLLDSLKNSRHMDTDESTGTADDDFIKGKLKLIHELGLPLEVHYQDNDYGDSNLVANSDTAHGQGTIPTFEWIEEELDRGQDVELGITWYDSAGNPDGGHWVTLSGKIDFGPGQPRGLYYRHDTEQDSAAGTEGDHFSWVFVREDGFLELFNESSNKIDIVVAESPLELDLDYLPGDVNMYNAAFPPSVIGSDATYLINYFRSFETSQPCLLNGFWASADVNGDCSIIGSDVTRLVNYLRGTGSIEYCPLYPPAWPPVPDLPPPGWPFCE
jgi:hypothetical protein